MKTAVCLAVKNAECIDSYCRHYLDTIGFDKVYLFEDKGSYSHLPFVEQFGNRVELAPLPNLPDRYYDGKTDTCVRQNKLYTWFLEQHRKDYDWIAFFDDDEYMVLPAHTTLHTFLAKFCHDSAIYLYWDILRTEDIEDSCENYLEQKNYHHYLKFEYNVEITWKLKSIVNTQICKNIINVHFADKNGVDIFGHTLEEIKKYQRIEQFVPYDKLYTIPHIKHFYMRSFESWFKKIIIRGDMTYGHRKLHEWFAWTDYKEHEKNAIIAKMMHKYHVPKRTFAEIIRRNADLKQYYSE